MSEEKTALSACPRKRVRFWPRVQIADAGGKKEDRFNPELGMILEKNIQAARIVGGTRQLAELSLKWA